LNSSPLLRFHDFPTIHNLGQNLKKKKKKEEEVIESNDKSFYILQVKKKKKTKCWSILPNYQKLTNRQPIALIFFI
jgi:exoribonuclease II